MLIYKRFWPESSLGSVLCNTLDRLGRPFQSFGPHLERNRLSLTEPVTGTRPSQATSHVTL